MFSRRVDPTRIADVLLGVRYPARAWQVFAHVENYGADRHTRIGLARVPADIYRDLDAVVAGVSEVYPSIIVAAGEVTRS